MDAKFDARRLSPAAQEDLRRRVVHAVIEQKLCKAEAARTFGISRTSVHNWVSAYRRRGERALRSKPRGRPRRSRLAGWQAATAVRLISHRCPDQLGLPFALWTREAVGQLLAQRFGLHVSVWTVGRYLKQWGFTPQKPLRRAYEQNAQAVQRWLKQEYPAIRRKARKAGAEIHWGDEMGLRSDHQAGTSYGRRGQTPIIPGTGKRFGCNLISTLTNQGRLAFMVFEERFNSKVLIRFLRRLLRHSTRPVFLILDGHPVHGSAKVQRWAAQRSAQIRLFTLPGYSPDLNPDEFLNHDIKSNAQGRQRPRTKQQMLRNIRSRLRSTQRQPERVKRFFHHHSVDYAS
ncbi:MAG: IS630 family transposase [Planctomycetota bacterium]|jgi:transposase